jgi:hypothetical protein
MLAGCMPRTANERDLTPFMTPPAALAAGHRRARGIRKLVAAYSRPERRSAGSLVEMMDGIGGLGWSVAGFVVGAVFWHFIGFWSFVADVVLAGGPAAGIDQAARAQPQQWVRMADAETVARTDAAACTSLVLDRRTGMTSAVACGANGVSLPMDAADGREDRLGGHNR